MTGGGPPLPCPNMSGKFALFVIDPAHDCTTFVTFSASLTGLLDMATERFQPNLWFAIYKFDRNTVLFAKQVPATRWDLHTKFAGKTVTQVYPYVTPMATAYQIDDGYEWFFKTT